MPLHRMLPVGLTVLAALACSREIVHPDALGQLRIEVAVTDTAHQGVVAQLAIRTVSTHQSGSLLDAQWTASTDTAGRYTRDYRNLWVTDTLRVVVTATPPLGSGLSAASDSATGVYQVGGGSPLDTVRLALVLH